MKIVAGMLQKDGGEMLWQGRPVSFARPAEASANGIAMVHQESLLAGHLTVAENIYLGRESESKLGFINRTQHAGTRKTPDRGAQFSAGCVRKSRQIDAGRQATGGDLPGYRAGIKPSHLRRAYVVAVGIRNEEVFRIVRQLRDRQVGVIYITHRLDELRSSEIV